MSRIECAARQRPFKDDPVVNPEKEGLAPVASPVPVWAPRNSGAARPRRRLPAYLTCVSARFPRTGIWNRFPFNAEIDVAIQSPNQTPHITRVNPSRK